MGVYLFPVTARNEQRRIGNGFSALYYRTMVMEACQTDVGPGRQQFSFIKEGIYRASIP